MLATPLLLTLLANPQTLPGPTLNPAPAEALPLSPPFPHNPPWHEAKPTPLLAAA